MTGPWRLSSPQPGRDAAAPDRLDLEPLVSQLKQRAGVLGVVLLGSLARGEGRASSDIDLIALMAPGQPQQVEAFSYGGRPTEVFLVSEADIRAALAGRLAARTIAIWHGGRVLHDTDNRLAALLAEIEERYRRGRPAMSEEERVYTRFELSHLRGLLGENAAEPSPRAQASYRLLVAMAVRMATEALLAHERRWPVGLRSTLAALESIDRESAALAQQALVAAPGSGSQLVQNLLERTQERLGGALPGWP